MAPQKPINQTGPRGTYEPLELKRGGNDVVPMGNAKARDVGVGGPGRGRQVQPSGGQGSHGPANPGNPPKRRGID